MCIHDRPGEKSSLSVIEYILKVINSLAMLDLDYTKNIFVK